MGAYAMNPTYKAGRVQRIKYLIPYVKTPKNTVVDRAVE